MNVEPDSWLKSIFGHDVFRISEFGSESLQRDHLFSAIPKEGESFCYAKVPVGQSDVLHGFLDIGFKLVDVNITLDRESDDAHDPFLNNFNIREACENDNLAVQNIAGICFTKSRFHKDPGIPKEIANQIKRCWVENYFKGERGETLIVSELNGIPAGFLAIAKSKINDKTIRIIDLIGVHPEFQGKGAGQQMVSFFINDSIGKCDLLRVGTQIGNFPSLHLYEKSGFFISGADFVLHAHIHNGNVIK
jgi:ribosomal protein S18 acetylase RimI-like enzyme